MTDAARPSPVALDRYEEASWGLTLNNRIGEWVRYADVAALVAERDRLLKTAQEERADIIWCVEHSAQLFERSVPERAFRLAYVPGGEDGYFAAEIEGRDRLGVRFSDITAAEFEATGSGTADRALVARYLVRVARLDARLPPP